jgi:hypothetical protein
MVSMRWVRISAVSIVSLLWLTALAACAPASASGATLLIVTPSSIQAGFAIEVRATCGENVNPGFVSSRAFGSITLVPNHNVLADNVTVPRSTASGTYAVDLRCASGGRSSSQLTVFDGRHPNPNPHHGPATGGGEMSSRSGARLALLGGLGAILAGAGVMFLAYWRRRAPVRS